MRIRIDVEGAVLTASLADNATARDFVSLLPLALTFEDYASTEKISYLSRKLSTAGAPRGTSASVGDIMYYAPWGNLALFYRRSGHADGLVKLGALDAGAEVLGRPGTLRARLELDEG